MDSEFDALEKKCSQLEDDKQKLQAELREMERECARINEKLWHYESLIQGANEFAIYRLAVDVDTPDGGRVIFVSPSFYEMVGIKDASSQTEWFKTIHPDDQELVLASNLKAIETKRFDEIFRIYNPEKQEWRWIHAVSIASNPNEDHLHFVNGFMLDVTEQKLAENELAKHKEQLEDLVEMRTSELLAANRSLEREIAERQKGEENLRLALAEKEILLRETHHRVKNNLMNITSLMDLQTHYASSEQVLTAFQDCRDRVRAMCMVHQQLYRSDDLGRISLAPYLDKLINTLMSAHGGNDRGIAVVLAIDDIFLDLDRAIACGLIINELISNSLKYAFDDQKGGKILIKAKQDANEEVEVRYSDDGVGLLHDYNPMEGKTLGLRLAKLLAEGQLGGQFERVHGAGTIFRILFRNDEIVMEDQTFQC